MEVKKGQVILISRDDRDDYTVVGHVLAKEDFNVTDSYNRFIANGGDMAGGSYTLVARFISYMVAFNLADVVQVEEFNV